MSSKIIIDGTTPSKLYIGNSEIKKAYIGTNLVFQKQKELNSLFSVLGSPIITEDGIMKQPQNNIAEGIVLTEKGLSRLKSGTIISLTYDYNIRNASGREWLYGYAGYGYSAKITDYPVCYSWDKAVKTRVNNETPLSNNRSVDNNVKITTTVKYSTNSVQVLSDTGEVTINIDISSNPMPFSSSSSITWGIGHLTETRFFGNIYLAESYIQFPDEDKKYYFYQ